MKLLKHILILALLCLFTTASIAETKEKDELEALSNQIKTINYKLDRGNFDQDDLTKWTKVAIKLGSEASVCITDKEASIKKLEESTEGLGEKVKDEAADVTKQRNKLQEEKELINKTLAQCNLYKLTADKASEHISLAEKSYFKEKYLIRGPHIYTLIVEYLKSPFELIADSGTFFWKHAGIQELDTAQAILISAVVVLMVMFGLWIRRILLRVESRIEWHDDFSEHFAQAALTTFAQYLPWLTGAATAAIILSIVTRDISPTPFITTLALALLIYLAFLTTVRFIFNPVKPAQTFIYFTPGIAIKLSRRLRILALHGLLHRIFRKHSRTQPLITQGYLFITDCAQPDMVVYSSGEIAKTCEHTLVTYCSYYHFCLFIDGRVVRIQKSWLARPNIDTSLIYPAGSFSYHLQVIQGPVQRHG